MSENRISVSRAVDGTVQTTFAEDLTTSDYQNYISSLHQEAINEKVQNGMFRHATKDVMLPLLNNNFKEIRVDFSKLAMALTSIVPKLATGTKPELIMGELQKVLDMMGIKFPIDELAKMIEDENRKAIICQYYES